METKAQQSVKHNGLCAVSFLAKVNKKIKTKIKIQPIHISVS